MKELPKRHVMTETDFAFYRQIVGNKLRAIRKDLEASIEEMSEVSGISRSYLSDFERGVRLPTVKYLLFLNDHCDVNLHYIFDDEQAMYKRRPGGRQPPPYEPEQMLIDFLVKQMEINVHFLHAVLAFEYEYRMAHKEIIEAQQAGKTDEEKRANVVEALDKIYNQPEPGDEDQPEIIRRFKKEIKRRRFIPKNHQYLRKEEKE